MRGQRLAHRSRLSRGQKLSADLRGCGADSRGDGACGAGELSTAFSRWQLPARSAHSESRSSDPPERPEVGGQRGGTGIPGTPPTGAARPRPRRAAGTHQSARRVQGLPGAQAGAEALGGGASPHRPRFPRTGAGRGQAVGLFWQLLRPGAVPTLVSLGAWLPPTGSQGPRPARFAGRKRDLPPPQGPLRCHHGEGQTSLELTSMITSRSLTSTPGTVMLTECLLFRFMGYSQQAHFISRVDIVE